MKSLLVFFNIFVAIVAKRENACDHIPPWEKNCILAEPICPNERVSYWLYNRNTITCPTLLKLDNLKTNQSDVFTNGPVILYLHGISETHKSQSALHLYDAYLSEGDYNIIAIDYSSLATSSLCYVTSVFNSQTVANCTAQLVELLNLSQTANMTNYHIIGMSLGAQVAGLVRNYLNGTIPRITGLDPAGPCFNQFDKDKRLSPDDSEFVEVIHTNAGTLGINIPCGHIDFYLNGGSLQPGCGGRFDLCNHERSIAYYTESINTEVGFFGYQCLTAENCKNKIISNYIDSVVMGNDTPKGSNGMFYVTTNDKSPYAKGHYVY